MERNRVLVVCGSRTVTRTQAQEALAKSALWPACEYLITGGAPGADTYAHNLARPTVKRVVLHADWQGRGKAAGPERNARMIEAMRKIAAEHGLTPGVIALWDGSSRGTADTLRRARALGVEVEVWECPMVKEG